MAAEDLTVPGEAKPYSKAQQLARGERRYRRKVASPKQWQALRAEKLDGMLCRVCDGYRQEDYTYTLTMGLHHLIPRGQGGDDVADNLVPLHNVCHDDVHNRRDQDVIRNLLGSLSDAEYAYAVGKAGEDWAERIYGLRYSRV